MNEQKNQRKHVWAPSTLMLTLLQDPPISGHLVGDWAPTRIPRRREGVRVFIKFLKVEDEKKKALKVENEGKAPVVE